MEKYNSKKVVYLPGWMDLVKLHKEFCGLEIWQKDIDYQEKIETEYLIGNSLGCHFALLNWEKNRNTKLILINPLIEKKSFLVWIWRWCKYFFSEGWRSVHPRKIFNFHNFFQALKKANLLLQRDYWDVLNKLPKEKVLIVKGGKDNFFCDQKLLTKFKSKNLPVLEIPQMGHLWKKKYLTYLEEYIK